MSYADAVADLVRVADEAEVAIGLEKPEGEVARFCVAVFGPGLATEMARAGYPKAVEMPWIVEDLYLYGLDELSRQQAGYRFNAQTGAPSADWDVDRFVIADWAANPISVGPDGAVSYSRHGAGTWAYVRIAADLPAFFALLAVWLRYFVVVHGGDLFEKNDDFQISEEIRAEIRRDVLTFVEEADKDIVVRFLLGEL